jgi:GT2 family glycosyltransferase
MSHDVDILIPTCRRPAALAVTLTSLCAQTLPRFRVVVSDQTEDREPLDAGEIRAVARLLSIQGRLVEFHKHLPRRGMAEHRQFLLDQARSPYVLFLDDDLILEPDIVQVMLDAIQEEGCGLVGCGLIGLSFAGDVRPHEQSIEFWDGPVQPETIRPGTPQWERYRLHNAANLYHLQEHLGLPRHPLAGLQGKPRRVLKYRVAWVGGCVMYDRAKLCDVGGFGFWTQLPAEHCGEDVLAQQRVMARYGGCGLLPSGVYHQELPTTLDDRRVDAPKVLAH